MLCIDWFCYDLPESLTYRLHNATESEIFKHNLSIESDSTSKLKLCSDIVNRFFLPPAYVVRGKVIFILGNVCPFTIGGGEGGTPSQV